MQKTIIWMPIALLTLLLVNCSPKKLEEPSKPPEKAKAVKKTRAKRTNPYSTMVPQLVGQHTKAAVHVAFSPDGRFLASAGKDNLVKLWDTAGAGLVRDFKGHSKGVLMSTFSPDGKLLVSTSQDHTARIWDVASGKALHVLTKPKIKKKLTPEEEQAHAAIPEPIVNWAAFTADGQQVITASDDFALRLWAVKTGKLLQTLDDPGCRQRRVFRRRDASGWVSSAGCMVDGVSYLKFWDGNGIQTGAFGAEDRDAHYLTYDNQNQFLATADGSMNLYIYSAQGSFLKPVMVGTYHFCLTFGPGDDTLLVGTLGGEVFVFQVEGFKRIGKLSAGEKTAIDGLALNPQDGSLALALRNGKVLRFAEPVRLPGKK